MADFFHLAHPSTRNSSGLPSSRPFSPRLPRSSWTPADPPEPHQIGSFVLASSSLTLSPSALQYFYCYAITRLYQVFSLCGLLVAFVVLCVRFSYFVRLILLVSYVTATLDMGWWLAFAQQGLSPCKKELQRLAYLAHQRWRKPLADFVNTTQFYPERIYSKNAPHGLTRGWAAEMG